MVLSPFVFGSHVEAAEPNPDPRPIYVPPPQLSYALKNWFEPGSTRTLATSVGRAWSSAGPSLWSHGETDGTAHYHDPRTKLDTCLETNELQKFIRGLGRRTGAGVLLGQCFASYTPETGESLLTQVAKGLRGGTVLYGATGPVFPSETGNGAFSIGNDGNGKPGVMVRAVVHHDGTVTTSEMTVNEFNRVAGKPILLDINGKLPSEVLTPEQMRSLITRQPSLLKAAGNTSLGILLGPAMLTTSRFVGKWTDSPELGTAVGLSVGSYVSYRAFGLRATSVGFVAGLAGSGARIAAEKGFKSEKVGLGAGVVCAVGTGYALGNLPGAAIGGIGYVATELTSGLITLYELDQANADLDSPEAKERSRRLVRAIIARDQGNEPITPELVAELVKYTPAQARTFMSQRPKTAEIMTVMFKNVFGRDPGRWELDAWQQASATSMAGLRGIEHQMWLCYVTHLTLLGRGPTVEESKAWGGQLSVGSDARQLTLNLAKTPAVAAHITPIVTAYYAGLLERTPEEGVVAAWIARIAENRAALGQLEQHIEGSPEYNNCENRVKRAYRGYLDREVTSVELREHCPVGVAVNVDAEITKIATSPSAGCIAEQVLYLAFEKILGRPPRSGEVTELRKGQKTLPEVTMMLIKSEERMWIEAYQAYVGRNPTQEEMKEHLKPDTLRPIDSLDLMRWVRRAVIYRVFMNWTDQRKHAESAVQSMYLLHLRRLASAEEIAGWLGGDRVEGVMWKEWITLAQIEERLMDSGDAVKMQISSAYALFLGRPAKTWEIDGWSGIVAQQATRAARSTKLMDVLGVIRTSDEAKALAKKKFAERFGLVGSKLDAAGIEALANEWLEMGMKQGFAPDEWLEMSSRMNTCESGDDDVSWLYRFLASAAIEAETQTCACSGASCALDDVVEVAEVAEFPMSFIDVDLTTAMSSETIVTSSILEMTTTVISSVEADGVVSTTTIRDIAVCGNLICEHPQGENGFACPTDCGIPGVCGNGSCERDIGEDETMCGVDCSEVALCGDDFCNRQQGEDAESCASDCGAEGWCGDGVCDVRAAEDVKVCPEDCLQSR